jgi:NAD(P)-dependent dehydrogenase (short-subunit alcohol dehydrogenase family)
MEGCAIAICDKEASVLEPALKSVQEAGKDVKAKAYPVDLTKADEIQRLVGSVKEELGPVSILVTNSGGPPPGAFDAADDEKWISAYSLTFLSAVRLIRGVLPDMKAQKWGRIINFTSRSLKPSPTSSSRIRCAWLWAAWPRPWRPKSPHLASLSTTSVPARLQPIGQLSWRERGRPRRA